MLIRFIDPDPRAGMTVRMDSRRGQELVDAGSAEPVPDTPVVEPAPSKDATDAPKPPARRTKK